MADTTITALPNASALSGSERVPMDQNGVTVDASTQQIADLVTKASLGLGNVNNTSDANKPISTATQAALDAKASSSAANTLAARLDAFRDAATFYVSKRGTASDGNNGTSPGEPFLTIGAAVSAANTYITANPTALARIEVGPGTYTEGGLPFRLKPNILVRGAAQRGTIIKPASGQELNGFFAVDSGDMLVDFRFAGHQATGTSDADSNVGTRAWAIRFNEQANGGQGPIITASPYVKDCASITAEDDDGLAGSTSVGDTGGGIEVDGNKCHPSSPVRSMVVYGYTQQNLGGPGVVVKNDAYAELVSFFGLFCTWHVQAETGGWATLSGGGCSEFGLYGIVADGYSSTALYTGSLRVAASTGALSVDVISLTTNRLGSSNRPHNGQIMLLGGVGYVVTSSSPINSSGTIVADTAPTRAGYRVSLYNPTGAGLAANAAQGASVDFRRRSQVSAGCHTALFVGSGTNYNALPWNGGVPIRANTFVERNFGRVFGLNVNDAGDITAAGGAFAVDGTSGAVTINTTSFNLSGLNAVGPFSRNGGVSTVGVQIQECSNNTSLLASTGAADGNTVPTQFAVAGYVAAQLSPYLTSATAASTYQPLNANLTALGAYGTAYYLSRANHTGTQAWSTITSTPTTLSGYGITDGFTQANVRATPLTGFVSGAGTITAADSVLTAIQKLNGNVAASGTGSVTSVGLSLPALFSVTGSPVTTSGTLTATLATQTANTIFAGPSTGSAAAPTFRALVANDLPSTAVTAGSYAYGSFTVDAQGRLTAASSGTAPISAVLSGYTAAAGTVTATDTILQAIQKIDGNDALKLPITFTASAITYAASVALDLAALAGGYRTLALTGDVTFTTSNRASGRQVTIRITADATQRTLTFPAGWTFIGTKPSTIAASKTAVLSLTFFGTADTDCVAAYGVQS